MAARDPHPRDDEAAEYVLGTLPWPERIPFEAAMTADPALAASVRTWEGQLVELTASIDPVAPASETWSAIARRIEQTGATILAFPQREIETLRRARARWRSATVAAGSIAAALAAFVAYDRAAAPNAPALMAVVNRDGVLPALVVRVDQRLGTIQVRSLAAEVPADHSLELWSVADGSSPRTLGLVPAGAGRLKLPNGAGQPAEGVIIAVSVEPRGGSPTGSPTGPVVYSGRLVPDLP